jgi:TRAP-type C4-dicarboxylate transport system substrate-binding protein
MKKLVTRFFFLSVALVLGAGSAGAEPAKHKIKLATIAPVDSPWDDALKTYKKQVEKRTQGTVSVQLYVGGRLGSETETINQVKFGSTECAGVSTGAFAGMIPGLDVFELPFLWENPEQAAEALKRLHPHFDKEFQAKGFRLIGWSENGWRNFMNAGEPIRSLADLKGVKVRSQENSMHIGFWKALEAKPVPLATTEFERAMKSGQIQAGDNSVVLTAAFGWNNTIKSFTLSRHSYQPAVIVCNLAWFEKLPAELQSVVTEEMVEVEQQVRTRLAESEKQFIEIFKSQGIAVHTLAPEERAKFVAQTESVRKKFSAAVPAEVLKVVEQVKAGR